MKSKNTIENPLSQFLSRPPAFSELRQFLELCQSAEARLVEAEARVHELEGILQDQERSSAEKRVTDERNIRGLEEQVLLRTEELEKRSTEMSQLRKKLELDVQKVKDEFLATTAEQRGTMSRLESEIEKLRVEKARQASELTLVTTELGRLKNEKHSLTTELEALKGRFTVVHAETQKKLGNAIQAEKEKADQALKRLFWVENERQKVLQEFQKLQGQWTEQESRLVSAAAAQMKTAQSALRMEKENAAKLFHENSELRKRNELSEREARQLKELLMKKDSDAAATMSKLQSELGSANQDNERLRKSQPLKALISIKVREIEDLRREMAGIPSESPERSELEKRIAIRTQELDNLKRLLEEGGLNKFKKTQRRTDEMIDEQSKSPGDASPSDRFGTDRQNSVDFCHVSHGLLPGGPKVDRDP